MFCQLTRALLTRAIAVSTDAVYHEPNRKAGLALDTAIAWQSHLSDRPRVLAWVQSRHD